MSEITIMDDAITEETKYQEFDDAESVNFTTRGLEGLVRDFSQLLLHSPPKMSDVIIKVKVTPSHNFNFK